MADVSVNATPAPSSNVGCVPLEATARGGADCKTVGPFGGTIKGGKQWNEDSYYCWCSPHRKVVVGAVFDGHGGYNGLLASQECVIACVKEFEIIAKDCESWEVPQWKSWLHELFAKLHRAIQAKLVSQSTSETDKRFVDEKGVVRSANKDPIHGGTTASVIVQFTSKEEGVVLVGANVGDSHAFLCSRRSKNTEFLTVDHGPESQEEYKRVQSLPDDEYPTKLLFVYDKTNVYRKYECPLVFLPNGTKDLAFVRNPWGMGLHPTNVRYEPAVYAVTPRTIAKDSTCIAMTRSLGDFYAQQFGLSYVPSITVRRFKAHHKKDEPESKEMEELRVASGIVGATDEESEFTVVVASDGIWDCWKYNDFTEYMNDTLRETDENVKEAVERVLQESIRRAKANFGVKHFDDASLIGWRIAL